MAHARPPIGVRVLLALCAAMLAAYLVRALTGAGGEALAVPFSLYVYPIAILLGGLACVWRATRPGRDRIVWLLLAAVGMSSSAGDVTYSVLASMGDEVPYPSLADAFWVLYGPLLLALVVAGARVSLRARPSAARWLDAVMVAFTVAAISGALVIGQVAASGEGLSAFAYAVNLYYPLADIAVIAAVLGLVALRGWQMDLRVAAITLGVLVEAVGDSVYLRQIADGTYVEGSVVDVVWIFAALAWGVAAWLPPSSQRVRMRAAEILGPVLLGLAALATLVGIALGDGPLAALLLSAAAIAVLLARMGVTLAENAGLLAESRIEATTDTVTGLGNRRKLVRDLAARGDRRVALTIFDLNGFKAYNDTFGHLAGDGLLERIGAALQAAVGEDGAAYRMGGDEFCAIVDAVSGPSADALAAAMAQRGEGFAITAAHGTARVPDEGEDPLEALKLADQRMYANKHRGRAPADRQAADALLAVLAERSADLGRHVDVVAGLAERTAAALGLTDAERTQVRHAAALHDIGKLAIPQEILDKPGPLDEEEWAFMRRHTIIGERVLDAAPALRGAAAIVRASHERWDGRGYPDGVAGTDIPLGARIVFVCDAYDAMVERRPYSEPRTSEEALAELRRCAGGQFDPAVVEAFARALAEQTAAPAQAAAA